MNSFFFQARFERRNLPYHRKRFQNDTAFQKTQCWKLDDTCVHDVYNTNITAIPTTWTTSKSGTVIAQFSSESLPS